MDSLSNGEIRLAISVMELQFPAKLIALNDAHTAKETYCVHLSTAVRKVKSLFHLHDAYGVKDDFKPRINLKIGKT